MSDRETHIKDSDALLAQAVRHREMSDFLTGVRGTFSSHQFDIIAGMDELSARRYAQWQTLLDTRLRDEANEHERLRRALERAVRDYQENERQTKRSFDH